ncbi:hypothetical protein SAMN04488120_106137 [Fontimonas thermophila]|uniref:Polyketide cyclase / dehydrase and lipid transport n=1 Tax=Fontimonas thermophila TaxID=1076937 RepID=A0A1I2JC53_9GAMM|nr:hypothetical protein [Fontimonas thermophila]SFF51678.1 hypothetical protein SAMN04488120_106137 [Fontimonas thermophila]
MKAIAGLILGMTCSAVHAAQIETLHVEHSGQRYRMILTARLDTPLHTSFRVFRDFDNLPRINDAVELVRHMDGAPPGAERLHTRLRICVWFFCTHLDQVQDIRETHETDVRGLDAVVLPQLSNLRYGVARWRMRTCGAQTCLAFEAEIEPDFWVPPIIGPWAIEHAMRREGLDTAAGIERLAAQESGS